ncbi:hypothetical protein [Halovulum sp. GXIMD14793]
MYEFIFSNNMFPFTLSLALVFGLLLLEVIALLLGGSLISSDTDAPDLDIADLDIEIDIADMSVEPELDIDKTAPGQPGLSDGAASAASGWFGLGKVPFVIWLATLLTGVGLSGFILQSGMRAVFD